MALIPCYPEAPCGLCTKGTRTKVEFAGRAVDTPDGQRSIPQGMPCCPPCHSRTVSLMALIRAGKPLPPALDWVAPRKVERPARTEEDWRQIREANAQADARRAWGRVQHDRDMGMSFPGK